MIPLQKQKYVRWLKMLPNNVKNKNSNDMKDKLTIISDDLNHDIITELEALKQLLILLGVSTCTD